jgi:hypothetical protein
MKRFFSKIGTLLTVAMVIMAFVPADGLIKKSKYKAYFGCTYTDSMQLSVDEFKQLIQKPLCVKDSAGNLIKVESFEIMYAERGLYQDDEGLPIIVTDYSNVVCKGDTIPQKWIQNFNERSYKGDTIFFDRVRMHTPENKLVECRTVKVILK